ncbi:hypothetical protein BS17DRAFT_773779 [Gyrodon lividus]|nr:hypothetical protein BS17DRAFT_773779 [Gyrodon lividus]
MHSSAHPKPTGHPSLDPPETYGVTHLSAHSYRTKPLHINLPITRNTLTKITPHLAKMALD